MDILVPVLLFVFAWCISAALGHRKKNGEIQRLLGVGVSCIGLFWLMGGRLNAPPSWEHALAPLMMPALHLMLAAIGYLAVPKRVLERPETPLFLLLHGLLLFAFLTRDLVMLVLALAMATCGILYLARLEPERHSLDLESHERLNAFLVYRLISAAGLIVLLCAVGPTLFTFPTTDILTHLQMSTWARVAVISVLASSLGLFPLHSWFISFLSAPRLNIFPPFFVIEVGAIILVRFLAPISMELGDAASILLAGSCVGMVYFALLFFGETRLKRIVGYLLLSYTSLLSIAILTTRNHDTEGIFLGLANIIISGAGLLICLSLLASRFGRAGVIGPSGLAKAFPELAVCFLACSLSLVGFPGTIGFMSEELLLKGTIGYEWILLPLVLLAIALNGYSCFRLFARVFYGAPTYGSGEQLALSLRELIAVRSILVLLIINGVIPQSLIIFSNV